MKKLLSVLITASIFIFPYQPNAWALDTFAPNIGPAAGGTTVVYTSDTALPAGVPSVLVGAKAATNEARLNNNQISFVTPSGTAGVNQSVTFQYPGGQNVTITGAFMYAVPPKITSITPGEIASMGGNFITITGTGFVDRATVKFGGLDSSTVLVMSATQIQAYAPAQPADLWGEKVDVVVTNPDTLSDTLVAALTIVPPVGTSVAPTPNVGPTSGGTIVTVVQNVPGQAFPVVPQVLVGANQATGEKLISPYKISFVTPANNTPGSYTVQVTFVNHFQMLISGGFNYDGPPPTITSISPTSGSQGTAVTITGTNFENFPYLYIGGIIASNFTRVSATQITAAIPAGLSAGPKDIKVHNPDGHEATLTGGFTNIAPPVILSVSPAGGALAGGTNIFISGSNFQNGVTVTVGGAPATQVIVNFGIRAVTPPHAAGTVDVVVTNPDGGTATDAGAFTYSPAPSISTISPKAGTYNGGTTITVNGSNFKSGASVTVNGTPAINVTFVSASKLTAVTPAGPMGDEVDLIVTNPDFQIDTLTKGFTYIPPTGASLSPSFGPAAGGTLVTMLLNPGFAIRNTVSVNIGGVLYDTGLTYLSDYKFTLVTQARTPGPKNVIFTTQGSPGTSTTIIEGFLYLDANTSITSITPNTGSMAGGTPITITGTNFHPGVEVRIHGVSASNVVRVSATQITAVTPPLVEGPANVQILNRDDGTATVLQNGFTFTNTPPGPVVTSVSPNKGPTVGGTKLTITGQNFQNGATVTVGGTAGTSVNVLSATTLEATTPTHNVGPVSIVVTNLDGQSMTATNAFTYYYTPLITSLNPATGPIAGGTAIHIYGTDFEPTTIFTIGGVPVTNLVFIDYGNMTGVTGATTVTGPQDVTATNTSGMTSTKTGAFTYFQPGPAPIVSSVSPNSGPTTGQTFVTITGNSFTGGVSLTIGGTPATTISFLSASKITALTPAGTAGLQDIIVTNPDGQSATLAGAFTYITPPPTPTPSPTPAPVSVNPSSEKTLFSPAKGEQAQITITLNQSGMLTGTVYDRTGKELQNIDFGNMPAGSMTLNWKGRDQSGSILPSGYYVLVLKQGGSLVKKQKIVLIR